MELINQICWAYLILVTITSFYYITFKVRKDFGQFKDYKKEIEKELNNNSIELDEPLDFQLRKVFYLQGIYNSIGSLFVLIIILFTGLFALLIALLYK
jgi:hypothetical protein